MKYGHHILAAALISGFGLAASAQAQTPPGPPQGGPGAPATMTARGDGHHGRFDPARMQERMAKRMAALKQKLSISAAQDGAWTTWTSAMKPPAHTKRPERGELAKLTTPERIDRMRARRAERSAEMDKRADATKTFYAALTPEQKKVFDAETAHMGRRGGRMGHHHRG
ncbi:MAG: Spy/CpxP family protein refolding chaperone [Pseudomonadota bacterium]